MRNKTPLVLMEQLLMVLVFALASAICVQAFALSDRLSKESSVRDEAVVCAQSMAEVWKSVSGDAAAAAACYGGSVEQGLWTVETNGLEACLLGVSQENGVRTAVIEVAPDGGRNPIFSLTVACQEVTP